MAQWRHLATWNLVNILSGNDLLPDGTKPLPEPELSYRHMSVRFCDFHLRVLLGEDLQMPISKTIQFNSSVYSDTLVPYKIIHINIDIRKKNQIICSREYVILNRDHAVHINSTIISIEFLSKFGIDNCCSLILSSDDNKAAWPLSSSVRSFFSTSNLSAYLRFIDMGELQKWALRANKLIKRFSLDIQVAKNVLNLSMS